VYALAREGLPLTIVDAHIERAIDLVHRLRHVLDDHSFSVYRLPQDLANVSQTANLIVNATNIGMWPDSDRSPWPDDLPFPPNTVVYDLISWPLETKFLRQARAYGAKTINGLPLVLYEAALAIEKWTGQPCPINVIQQAVQKMFLGTASMDWLLPTDVLALQQSFQHGG
jgi:shikimate dehydrogenase